MNWNPLHMALLVLVLAILLPWHLLHDDISCVVSVPDTDPARRDDDEDARPLNVNGYYVAMGGVYVRKSERVIDILPDFFGLVAMSRTAAGVTASSSSTSSSVIISQDRHRWLIQLQEQGSGGDRDRDRDRDRVLVRRRDLYFSAPEHAQQQQQQLYLFRPPPVAWRRITTLTLTQTQTQTAPSAPSSSVSASVHSVPSGLTVGQCRGSLVSGGNEGVVCCAVLCCALSIIPSVHMPHLSEVFFVYLTWRVCLTSPPLPTHRPTAPLC